jgi:hypothetical protein
MASISTRNSARVKPDTIISVEAGGVPGKLPVPRSHVALHVLACGHVGVEADDISQRHAIFGEDRGDVGEAKLGLCFAICRDGRVGTNAELARGHDQPVPRGHRDAVAVPGKGRFDRLRRERAQDDRTPWPRSNRIVFGC